MKLRNDFNNRQIRRKLNFKNRRGKRRKRVRRLHTILPPHPPSAQFSLGVATLLHRAKGASDFLENNFPPDYGFAFSQTSLHSGATAGTIEYA
jgi:hypothetical protein